MKEISFKVVSSFSVFKKSYVLSKSVNYDVIVLNFVLQMCACTKETTTRRDNSGMMNASTSVPAKTPWKDSTHVTKGEVYDQNFL